MTEGIPPGCLSQHISLFSPAKQMAPVLSTSYFSMPVSCFTLTLSPACVWMRAEPNFPFSAPSGISDQDQSTLESGLRLGAIEREKSGMESSNFYRFSG